MKQDLFIILSFFLTQSIVGQNYQMIDSKHHADNTKDCRKIGNCIKEKYIKDDTLYLTIFIDNNCRDLKAYRDSFIFKNDTLSINLNDTSKAKYKYVFNKEKNKIDTIVSFRIASYHDCVGGYDTQRNEYKLVGFKSLPKIFQFNYRGLCDCPTKPIKYDLYKNDTINMINENGNKHGLWIVFYDTGEIQEKKMYNNGRFISGTNFDKEGNDLHWISEGDGCCFGIIIDSVNKSNSPNKP